MPWICALHDMDGPWLYFCKMMTENANPLNLREYGIQPLVTDRHEAPIDQYQNYCLNIMAT
jgi:hypothetical protein